MTRGSKARPAAALASALVTLVAFGVVFALTSPSQAQSLCGPPLPDCPTTSTTDTTTTATTEPTTTTTAPPQWEGSHWAGPTSDGETVSDGTFSGTFVYAVPGSIVETDLAVRYSPADTHVAACGDGKQSLTQPAPSTTTSTPATPSSDSQTDSMDFLFEVGFVCNGLYDVTATGKTDSDTHDMKLKSLHIAVPPPSPLSLNATDNGNQTVTLTWEHPSHAPVDTVGYRLSKRASSSQTFTPVTDTDANATTFTESGYPSGGGSFVYKVETLRSSPNGNLVSAPVVTDGALTVNGVGHAGTSGGSVGGKAPPASKGPVTQYFDSATTLPGADEDGAGNPLAAVPGGDTIQRFTDNSGAGLIKPFAAALDLGVWAGLLLFLTRRAAREERAELLSLELEHTP